MDALDQALLREALEVAVNRDRRNAVVPRETLRNVVENPSNEGPLWNAETWAFAAEASP